jgi:formiminoglutamase
MLTEILKVRLCQRKTNQCHKLWCSDFRILEGRHSGTVFRMLMKKGFKKYFIFLVWKLHFKKRLRYYKKNRRSCTIQYLRQRKHSKRKRFQSRNGSSLRVYKWRFFGIEIDLDSIPNIACSAMTLSGFSVEQLRQFISYLQKKKRNLLAYLWGSTWSRWRKQSLDR